jgi:hypothetical protein
MRFSLPICIAALVACGSPALDTAGTSIHRACDDGEPYDQYVDGLVRATASGMHDLSLTADPGPPDVGPISFVVAVEDAAGPMTDGTVQMRPYMPLHGHGTVPEVHTGVGDGAGVYAFDPIYFFMLGLWEVHVMVDSGDGEIDEGLYRFCLEG